MTGKRYLGNIITDTPTNPTANSGANYGVANGVWSLTEAKTFVAAGTWPSSASAPSAPTIGTATAGDASVSVAFTPGATGGLTPTYTATSNPGSITGTGSGSPITVSGLTNGTAYTFTVTASHAAGTSAASSASNSATPIVPDSALFYGGQYSVSSYFYLNSIYKRTITTLGNASGFGSLSTGATVNVMAGASSSTRAVVGGGLTSSATLNVLQYIEYSSTGNATDFGDLTTARYTVSGGGNSTRGIYYGGRAGPRSSTIDYITIASTGNATDFGDTVAYGQDGGASYASTTEFFYAGGEKDGQNYTSNRYKLTIASTGNATYYGGLSNSRDTTQGASNSTYGIVGGGTQASAVNTIDRHTMSSNGTSTDFGDMTENRSAFATASNSTRVLFAGGNENTSTNNSKIMYITIASTGNTTDFGTAVSAMRWGGASNAHGGL